MNFKFSDRTLNLLQNFATINTNMMFRQGSEITTVSDQNHIMAFSSIEEEIPRSFGIYDLSEFLNLLTLVDDYHLQFEDNYLLIKSKSDSTTIQYFYSPEEVLKTKEKPPSMPEADLEFELDDALLSKIKRAGSTLGLDHLYITPIDNGVKLSVAAENNATSNTFSVDIAAKTELTDFTFVILISNIKVVSGKYKVGISRKGIANLENVDYPTQYWNALDKESKVNG
jgi:hypothetical protein